MVCTPEGVCDERDSYKPVVGEGLELESPENRDSLIFPLTPSAARPVPCGWVVGTPELGVTRL